MYHFAGFVLFIEHSPESRNNSKFTKEQDIVGFWIIDDKLHQKKNYGLGINVPIS